MDEREYFMQIYKYVAIILGMLLLTGHILFANAMNTNHYPVYTKPYQPIFNPVRPPVVYHPPAYVVYHPPVHPIIVGPIVKGQPPHYVIPRPGQFYPL